MKVVILGYSGLIGSCLLENLIKNTNYHIICVGRKIEKKPLKNFRIKYIKWDFNTFHKTNLFFLKKSDVIVNCIGKTNGSFNSINRVNVIFIKKLLKFINFNKLKIRLVHLSSIAVYRGNNKILGQKKTINENNSTKSNDLYSKTKLEGDLLVQYTKKKNSNKNFSYTILRISNVFGGKKNSNLFKFIKYSLKFGFWIKCKDDIVFNLINVKDVVQATILTISKMKLSKNKVYIVSDDCKQNDLYKNYEIRYKKKINKINLNINFIKFINIFSPISKKLLNFILIISNRISYNNKKIKSELNFKPKFSLQKLNF